MDWDGGFSIWEKYPDKTRIQKDYKVRTINGKKIEILLKSYRSVTDPNTNQRIGYDTVFHKDGVTPKQISKMTYADSFGTRKNHLEVRTFDKFGNLTAGSRTELGFDNKTRIYILDPSTQQFELEPTYIDGVPVPKTGVKTSYCPAPRSIVTVSYAFTKKDNGFEDINYKGVEASYSFVLGRTDLDTTGPSQRPRTPLSKFALRVLASFLSGGVDNGIETKWNLATVTVGPEFRLSGNRFVVSIFAQGGVAQEVFKFDDIKEDKTSLAFETGVTAGWFFGKHLGIQVSPQVLMTKFNDKSVWNFVGSAGLAYRMGCN